MKTLWSELTDTEIESRLKKGWDGAILPIGATEQHGPHLATGYDTFVAEKIAFELSQKHKIFLLPSLSYGLSDHHLGFSSTISVSHKNMVSVIGDIAMSLKKIGINRLYIVNGHGGNYPVISDVKKKFSKKINIITDDQEKLLFKVIRILSKKHSSAALGLHGGLFETSLALYTHKNHVRLNKISPGLMPKNKEWSDKEIKALVKSGLHGIAKTGIVGDPNKSSAVLGKKFYRLLFNEYDRIFFEK